MKILKINKSVFYQSEDGQIQLCLRVKDGSIWLNQLEIAELFQTTKQNISLHIRNILEGGECCRDTAVREFLVVQSEGRRQVRRHLTYYNLDLILATGSRLRSLQGVRFRQWADIHLKEFLYRNFIPDEGHCIHM